MDAWCTLLFRIKEIPSQPINNFLELTPETVVHYLPWGNYSFLHGFSASHLSAFGISVTDYHEFGTSLDKYQVQANLGHNVSQSGLYNVNQRGKVWEGLSSHYWPWGWMKGTKHQWLQAKLRKKQEIHCPLGPPEGHSLMPWFSVEWDQVHTFNLNLQICLLDPMLCFSKLPYLW